MLEDVLFMETWDFRTPRHFVLECCRMALTENYFEFEEQLFLQSHGTSMGSAFAPSVAGLYVSNFETNHVLTQTNPYVSSILYWKRYIDDVLLIWHNNHDLKLFVEWLNTRDPWLRFTYIADKESIDFLDLTIYSKDNKIETKTFRKPTAKNSLLSYKSYHPQPLRDNLPYSQFLRLKRNCSQKTDYLVQSKDLSIRLQQREYKTSTIKKCQKRALNQPRENLLTTFEKRENADLMTCVTTFGPASYQVNKLIQKNWHIVNTGQYNWPKPRFANKRTKNLRDMLVHTRPRQAILTKPIRNAHMAPVTGHYPCGSCLACKSTTSSKTLQLSPTLNWTQRQHSNCNSSHVIYMVTCPCEKKYIGMTCRKVKLRIGEHKSNIRLKKNTTKLCSHFVEQNHSIEDLRWTVIEKIPEGTPNVEKVLYEKEQRWVDRLKTNQYGLNDEISWHHFAR